MPYPLTSTMRQYGNVTGLPQSKLGYRTDDEKAKKPAAAAPKKHKKRNAPKKSKKKHHRDESEDKAKMSNLVDKSDVKDPW